MTKKHFEAFARHIQCLTDRTAAKAFARLVAEIAAEDNPRFDRERFMLACKLRD